MIGHCCDGRRLAAWRALTVGCDAAGSSSPTTSHERKCRKWITTTHPELIAFAQTHGVKVMNTKFPPDAIRPHQRIDLIKAKQMGPHSWDKPILTSIEPIILDGHHRWYEHKLLQTMVPAIVFELEFEAAIKFLFSFPKTYAYGDGKDHPESA